MSAKRVLHVREFLNADGGMAAVEAEAYRYDEEDRKSLSATVSLSDCTRKVELDFSLWAESDRPRVLGKIGRLIGALEWLRTVIVEHPPIPEPKPRRARTKRSTGPEPIRKPST